MDGAGTQRLEAFSDGVFAIAATLLVLEFTVSSGRALGSQLLHLWPSYLAYATSFVTIGIIWMNHHHTVSLLGRTDRPMLFLNNLLLLTIAFLPFPTRLVAQYLQRDGEQAAALLYAATFVLMAGMHQVWWQYARRNRRLIAEAIPDAALRAVDRAYLPGVPMYGTVFVVAFFSPLGAVFLTFAIAAFYLPSAALFDR
ncbi:MAG TPA: TMEM175 family protein [Gaiellaceae bacterium]|nr:TMEM175 family protein [Gaiellaceae bacterium]